MAARKTQYLTGGIRGQLEILHAAGRGGGALVTVQFFAIEQAVLRTERGDLLKGFAQFFKHQFLIHGNIQS